MSSIEWYDVAPAILFAVVAGILARFIGGTAWRDVVMGVGYLIGAGLVSAAAVAFTGLGGGLGFAGSIAVWAILVVPLWLYVNAVQRRPVSEAEMDETVARSEAIVAALPGSLDTHDVSDAAEFMRRGLDNVLWRLASDAPRRAEIIVAKDRLVQAINEAGGEELDVDAEP